MKKISLKFVLALLLVFCISWVIGNNTKNVVEFPLAYAAVIGISPACSGIIHICLSELDDAWKDVQNNCDPDIWDNGKDDDEDDDGGKLVPEDC